MARKDESGGEEDKDRVSGTLRAIRSVGHPASGGHSLVAQAIRQGNYVHLDDDDGDDDMPQPWMEYPKWVTRDGDGSKMVCQNEDEELTFLAGDKVIRDPEERKRLLKVAEVKGVQVDGRWALPRITQAIVDAGFDPTLNPFE